MYAVGDLSNGHRTFHSFSLWWFRQAQPPPRAVLPELLVPLAELVEGSGFTLVSCLSCSASSPQACRRQRTQNSSGVHSQGGFVRLNHHLGRYSQNSWFRWLSLSKAAIEETPYSSSRARGAYHAVRVSVLPSSFCSSPVLVSPCKMPDQFVGIPHNKRASRANGSWCGLLPHRFDAGLVATPGCWCYLCSSCRQHIPKCTSSLSCVFL